MEANDRLRELIRYELLPVEFDEKYYSEDFDGQYEPSVADLLAACNNMIDKHISWAEFEDWYLYITEDLSVFYEGIWDYEDSIDYIWTGDERGLFDLVMDAFNHIVCGDMTSAVFESLPHYMNLVIQMCDDYRYNRNHDVEEWKIGQLHMELILNSFTVEERIPDKYVDLFKKLLDIGCEQGNLDAMRTKGYSCYGGNGLYECDWYESRRLITKLFEKTGDPVYANTLGYIYYYGRCNDGVPEYEKAFQYYAVGAATGILESIYKQADMFMSGKGCIKSERAAEEIYFRLYEDGRPRFCQGDDAKFADIALRHASFYTKRSDYYSAYRIYLEADYAIKKRLERSDFFGDVKVQENITKCLEDTRAKIAPDYFVDKLELGYPDLLFDAFDGVRLFEAQIAEIEKEHYRMNLRVKPGNRYSKMLIVIPQFDYVNLTDCLEIDFITEKPIEYKCDEDGKINIDGIRYKANGYSFTHGKKEIFALNDVKFVLNRS